MKGSIKCLTKIDFEKDPLEGPGNPNAAMEFNEQFQMQISDNAMTPYISLPYNLPDVMEMENRIRELEAAESAFHTYRRTQDGIATISAWAMGVQPPPPPAGVIRVRPSGEMGQTGTQRFA